MAHFSRLDVLNTILETGLVPLYYHQQLLIAHKIFSACKVGGARVIEFTNRGEHALEVFASLAQYAAEAEPDVILGVGSVIDAPTAALFIAYGANFIVGPLLNPDVARLCNRRKIAYIPGCETVSEISTAEELGVEIVKLFPGGAAGGPGFIKAVLGPSPWTRLMPTGGVDATQESIHAWIGAGAACVGMGSNLIRQDLVAGGDYDAITALVAEVLSWILQARQPKN
jgi:2-dehydro-3-deoxyphosphogluconate aldolase/(4S)-4-hydroxy-2-oxoglutarate aldolase